MKPAPIVEAVDVDHLPGGDYHITASNQYRLLVGGGGVQIKTFGNIDIYGGIISIAGEQLTLSSKGEVLVNGKERTSLQGKRISINPDDYGQAVVNGSLGVTRQLLVNGATYHEGEVYLHHITAPLEYQTTECADSLKCATLEPCVPEVPSDIEVPLHIPTLPTTLEATINALGGMATPDSIEVAGVTVAGPNCVTAIEDIISNIPLLQGSIASLKASVDQLNSAIETINTDLEDLHTDDETLKTAAETLEAWDGTHTALYNDHTHNMPRIQHFHYFKNVPLDLYCKSEDVRKDACDAGINNTEQMPAKPVRTPIPNDCNIPCVCPGVPAFGPCAESYRVVGPDNAVGSGVGALTIASVDLNDWPTVNTSFNTFMDVDSGTNIVITEEINGQTSPVEFDGGVSLNKCSSATDIIFILDSTTSMKNSLIKIYNNIDYFSQRLTACCLNHRFGGITFGDNYGMTHLPLPGKTPIPFDQIRPLIAPTGINDFKLWLNDVITNYSISGDDIFNNAIDPIVYALTPLGTPVTTNPEGSYSAQANFNYYNNVAYILVTNTGFNSPSSSGNTDNWYASGGTYNSPIYNTYNDSISALNEEDIPCYTITSSQFNKSEYSDISRQTLASWYEISTANYSDIFRSIAASICTKYGGCPAKTDIVFLLDSTTTMVSSLTSLYNNMNYFARQLSGKCVDYKFGGITFGNNYGITHIPIQGSPIPLDQPRSFIAPTELGSVTNAGTFMHWLSTEVIEKVVGDNDSLRNPIDVIDYALADPLNPNTNPEGSYRDQANFNYRTKVVFILLTDTGFNTPSSIGDTNCWYASGGLYNSPVYNYYTDVINSLTANEIKCYTITNGAYDDEASQEYRDKYWEIATQSKAAHFDIPSPGFSQGYKPILRTIASDIKGGYKSSYISSAPSGSVASITVSVTAGNGFIGSGSTTVTTP